MYPIINLDDINLSAPYFVYASSAVSYTHLVANEYL